MLVAPGSDPPASLSGGQHARRSPVIDHDPGFSSQIGRDLCLSNHPDPSPLTRRRETRGLVHELDVKSHEIRSKLLEVEYPKYIEIVSAASFRELHQMFVKLSTSTPLGMMSPAFEAKDICLGKIFATFDLVCKACNVYHHF